MPGNTEPIFSRVGDVTKDGTTGMAPTLTTAAADYTGAGANNSLVFTADATNGGFVRSIRFKAIGTNVASCARIFINNGSTNGTATNNSFYDEVSLPATTASNTISTPMVEVPLNLALPAGFRIYVGLATTVAAGWVPVVVGGKY